MAQVKRYPAESFLFELLEVTPDRPHPEAPDRVVQVPVVNRWVQLSLPVHRVPSAAEQTDFAQSLSVLVHGLREARALQAWYFLHKPPGLRLRFRAAADPAALVVPLITALGELRWPFAGPAAFDSYFEQRELLSGYAEDFVADLLCLSAEAHLQALLEEQVTGVPGWSAFTIAFLHHFLPDPWWVWEALGRFSRLRGEVTDAAQQAGAQHSAAGPLPDPGRLLRALPPAPDRVPPGFAASVSLLTCLNYIYNQWTLDAAAQRAVLALSRELTRPELGP